MVKKTRNNLKNKPLNTVADLTNNQLMKSPLCESYEIEKLQVFVQMNNTINEYLIDKHRLERRRSLLNREHKMNSLAANVKRLQKLITQLQKSIKLERSIPVMWMGDLAKYEKELEQLNKKVEWSENSVHSLITGYNEIGEFLNFQAHELIPEINQESVPLNLDFISNEDRLKEEQQKLKSTEQELILDDLRSSTELLKSKIIAHGMTPNYKLLSKSTSGNHCVHKYSCSLYGMYVEGSGYSKSEAREDTATNMLRLILKKQKSLSLTSHIRPIGIIKLNDISHIKKSIENYVQQLEKTKENAVNKYLRSSYYRSTRTRTKIKPEPVIRSSTGSIASQ